MLGCTLLECTWESEARQVEMEAMALCLEVAAIHQEARANCIRDEAHMVAHRMSHLEGAVCLEEVEGIWIQNPHRRADYHAHQRMGA